MLLLLHVGIALRAALVVWFKEETQEVQTKGVLL